MPELPTVRDCRCCGPNITTTVVRGFQGQVIQRGFAPLLKGPFRDQFIMASGIVSGWTGVMPTRTSLDAFAARAYGIRDQMAIHKTGEVIRHVNIATGVTTYYRVKATAGIPLDVQYTATTPPGAAWEVVGATSYVRTFYTNAPASGGGFYRNGTTNFAVGDLIAYCVPSADESDDLWHIHDVGLCLSAGANPSVVLLLGTSSQFAIGGGAQLATGAGSYPGAYAQMFWTYAATTEIIAGGILRGSFGRPLPAFVLPGQLTRNGFTGDFWVCVKPFSTADQPTFSTEFFAPFNVMRALAPTEQAISIPAQCRNQGVKRFTVCDLETTIDSDDGSAEAAGAFEVTGLALHANTNPPFSDLVHITGQYPAIDKPIAAGSAPTVGAIVRTYNVDISFVPMRISGGSYSQDGGGNTYSDGTDQVTMAGERVRVITVNGAVPVSDVNYVCIVPRTTFEPAGGGGSAFVEDTGAITFEVVQRSQRVAYPELLRPYNEAAFTITDEHVTLISASRLTGVTFGETSNNFAWNIWIAKGTLRAKNGAAYIRNTEDLVNATVSQAVSLSEENTEADTLARMITNNFVLNNPSGAAAAFSSLGPPRSFFEGILFNKIVVTSIDAAGPQTASRRYRFCAGSVLCNTIAVPAGGALLGGINPQLGENISITFNRGC
jgi:hypothetical protein